MLAADGHKPKKDLRHAEISKTPCHGRKNIEEPIGPGGPELRLAVHHLLDPVNCGRCGNPEKFKESRDGFGIGDDSSQAAGRHGARHHDNDKRNDHDNSLHEIRNTFRQKPSDDRIDKNKNSADDHHGDIIKAK